MVRDGQADKIRFELFDLRLLDAGGNEDFVAILSREFADQLKAVLCQACDRLDLDRLLVDRRAFFIGAFLIGFVFDFFFDVDSGLGPGFAAHSIATAEITQQEDIAISEQVQAGLASGAYDRGRYAPRIEHAVHHFHRLLAADYLAALGG